MICKCNNLHEKSNTMSGKKISGSEETGFNDNEDATEEIEEE